MVVNKDRNLERLTTRALDLAYAFHYLYPWEVQAMGVLAQTLPAGARCVNIGAGSGTSSLVIVESRPDVEMWTVDISAGGPNGGLENERVAFREYGLPCPKQILGDSKEVGKTWDHGALDYLFIDGDHFTAGVKGDIEAWLPHVKPGGLVLFHDYGSPDWTDVKVWADRLMVDSQQVLEIDSLKVFRTRVNASGIAQRLHWMKPVEVEALHVLTQMLPGDPGSLPSVLNIGAGAGTSSLAFAETRPIELVSIDVSDGFQKMEREAFEAAGMPAPQQIHADSHAPDLEIAGTFDLIFIDADHNYGAVRADILKWRPQLKPGGILVFHDYGSEQWPGVKVAVDELTEGSTLILYVHMLKAFRL